MRTVLYFILLLLFGACTAPKGDWTRTDKLLNLFKEHPDSVLVVAHRGGHLKAPENSLAAIEEAINAGAHVLEIDVRQTKDGELILLHDSTLDRTTTGSGPVDSMAWKDVQALRLVHQGDTTDAHPITLKEALLAAKDRILVDLDFKIGTKESAERIYALIQELGMEQQVIFFLYDYRQLSEFHAMDPSIRVMPRARSAEDLEAIIALNLTDIIHIDESFSGHPALDQLRKNKVRLWANTLGKRDSAARVNPGNFLDFFASLPQANVVQTDEPELLNSFLRSQHTEVTVSSTMDDLVTRTFGGWTNDQLDALTDSIIHSHLSAEEKSVLSTKYWEFMANQPVRISIMSDQRQAVPPFWLTERGFEKSGMVVKNEMSQYDVWQKEFPAGKIALGINGFDKHRPVYFVSVRGLTDHNGLELTPIHPANQHLQRMQVGSFTYHDWDGLKLSDVPTDLTGDLLLSTIRGRAREAHLVRAFRTTAQPANTHPDQVVLTISDDPSTSMTVQWRTSSEAKYGEVIYWEEHAKDSSIVPAKLEALADRLILNDRNVHRYSATLTRLNPGKRYFYYVRNQNTKEGHRGSFEKSEVFNFKTADHRAEEAPLEFIWFGDTHNDAGWGETIQFAQLTFPSTQFYLHSGDLVNTGLHRDDWDLFFKYSHPAFARAPLMAVPGNHDSQDGLGAGLFRQLLKYPANGPTGLQAGTTYSFEYGNSAFFMIDAASFEADDQKEWLENALKKSKADWKFLVVHFPPYNEVEPYPALVAAWGEILEKHGVDFVLSGHFHYYMRTHPLVAGEIHPIGVRYLMSVGTTAAREAKFPAAFVEKRHEKGNLFQRFVIQGRKLSMTVYDKQGALVDEFSITKPSM